jgi:enoyl-[acyl-carrier protein] reductase III
MASWDSLDILVSNAASGVLADQGPPDEPLHQPWRSTQALLSLCSVSSCCRPGEDHMPSRRWGPHSNYTAVGASKAALESMVRHLAAELAPRGVRVNAVSGGTVDTDALKHFPNRDELLTESARRTPAGRLVTPQDIANAVVFLCTEYASMIHGQTVLVDGGYSIVA